MAAENDPVGLSLEAPFDSLAGVAQSMYPVVPVSLLLKDKYDSAALIKNVKAPKLFIHGERDRTIPIRFAKALFEAASEPKSFVSIDSAAHNDLYDHGAALHVLQFLSTIEGNKKD
ncbi:MAG: alpha/beta hydrolase [Micavibrio sp.]|nr:alpha/beta hydrolase [Micavibrio sp.]